MSGLDVIVWVSESREQPHVKAKHSIPRNVDDPAGLFLPLSH